MNKFSPGIHILVDFYGAQHVTETNVLRDIMIEAAQVAGATVLSCDLHEFGENSGVTGVAVLAESHISIHTWPEHDYAAIDIFMCGDADPHKAVKLLQDRLRPSSTQITTHVRGRHLNQ
jgi:S-adenosylmethionine decarboxylase